MWHFFSKHRVHESLVVAVLVATSLSFHAAWILNLLVVRLDSVRLFMTFLPLVGPVSGMYTCLFGFFVVSFLILSLYFKGRDVSMWRKPLFGFFLFSLFSFFIMTLPFVYAFSMMVE